MKTHSFKDSSLLWSLSFGVVLFFTYFFGFHAQARSLSSASESSQLRQEIEALNRACARGTCAAPYYRQQLTDLSADQLRVFTTLANDLAQVWGDTILEGDYFSEGNTTVDRVDVLYKNGTAFAFKIHYFESAYYTGECDFNGDRNSSLVGCESGKISESSYISVDLKVYFRDESQWAEFESNNP